MARVVLNGPFAGAKNRDKLVSCFMDTHPIGPGLAFCELAKGVHELGGTLVAQGGRSFSR